MATQINTGLNTTTAVLQGGLQPLQMHLQMQDRKRQDEALRQQQVAKQKENRDKKIGEFFQWNPDKAWEPHSKIVSETAQKYRDEAVQQFNAGVDPNSIEFRNWSKKRQSEINDLAAKTNSLKDNYTKAYQQINTNPYLKTNEAFRELNDLVYDEEGNGRNPFSVDINRFQNIVNDPRLFDKDKLAKDFVKALPQEMEKYAQTRNTEAGEEVTSASQLKRSIYVSSQRDPKTGTYKVNITDDLIEMANQNPYLRAILDSDDRDDAVVLQEVLGPSLVAQRDVQKSTSVKPQDDDKSGAAKEKAIFDRYSSIQKVLKGDRGEIVRMEGAKTGQGTIENVDFRRVEGQQFPYVAVGFKGVVDKDTGQTVKDTRRAKTFNLNVPEQRRAFSIMYNEAIDSKSSTKTKVNWEDLTGLLDEDEAEISKVEETRKPLGDEMKSLFE